MTAPEPAIDSLRFAVIGGGNMSETLLSGLLAETAGGLQISNVAVVEPNAVRAKYLESTLGALVTTLSAAVNRADVIAIVVKPHVVDSVLEQLSPLLVPGQLVVSLAGGTPLSRIEVGLSGEPAIIRCVPNIAVEVGRGLVAYCSNRYVTAAHVAAATALLAPVAKMMEVPEAQLDIFTALSGSGVAYYFYVVEALTDAGVRLGLSHEMSAVIAVETAGGAAEMLRATGRDPAQLRATVSSPGGTTIAAIQVLEDRAVRAAFIAAAERAKERATELGRD